jgi:hypothetical protein
VRAPARSWIATGVASLASRASRRESSGTETRPAPSVPQAHGYARDNARALDNGRAAMGLILLWECTLDRA